MRDRIVIANWKMNGSREANARWTDEFLSSPQPACRTVVCAPFVYLGELALRALGTHLEVGAEDVNENPAGAFTGEISAGMLHDIGMSCAIVGHSERRTLYGETDNRVAMKALALVKAGLKPVVCVGETLEEPYLSYNDLQRSQGFDLTRYCGQTLSRYTYVVTNYPDASLPCQADLYVCDGALAAGDIVCTGENGFMAGLAFPAN